VSCRRCQHPIKPDDGDGESYCYYCHETIRVCYKLTIGQYEHMKHLALTVQAYRKIFVDRPRDLCISAAITSLSPTQ